MQILIEMDPVPSPFFVGPRRRGRGLLLHLVARLDDVGALLPRGLGRREPLQPRPVITRLALQLVR